MDSRQLAIPEQDWRKLLAAASGDAALLYLYLRAGGQQDLAAGALRMNSAQYDLAASSLKQLGLWPEAPKILRPDTPPAYTEADLSQEMARSGSDFPRLLGEAQRRLGKVLNTEDAKILLAFYDYLGMPTEVVSLLISYCIQRARLRGSLRQPSIRTIEKEAYHWADLGIDTLDEASAYMQLELERHTKMGAIRKAMHLEGRKLTTAEERMLHQWLDWGFGQSEIVLAYEKTCMNTGSMKWPYMNSILSRWHDQGLMTVDAIHAGDKSPGKAAQPVQSEPSQFMKDAVARMLRQETQPSKPIRED
jgi:DnaD/phage-associated family protein